MMDKATGTPPIILLQSMDPINDSYFFYYFKN